MLCRFFRFMISSAADSGRSIGPVTSWHTMYCAGCRQFLQDCRVIDVGLRTEAAVWQRGLEQPSHRILPNFTGTPSPSHGFRIRMALAAAACLAIAAAVLLSLSMPAGPPQMSTPVTTAIIPADAPWAMQWVELIPNPLAAEAERLTRDTESGIRFLVACLDIRPLGAGIAPRLGDPASPPPQ